MVIAPNLHRVGTIAVVFAVVVASCGGGSGDAGPPSPTDDPTAATSLCTGLETHLESITLRYQYESPSIGAEIEEFRSRAIDRLEPESQIADWFCEMSERFPRQMTDRNFEGDPGVWPVGSGWGKRFLVAQFGLQDFSPAGYRGGPQDARLWANPATEPDDVFTGCEPGLGLRTPEIPQGVITAWYATADTGQLDIQTFPFSYTVASYAIRALKNGTFSEYQRAVAEEWRLTFDSELLDPPYFSDGIDQTGFLVRRIQARLMDASNLLYIKYVCPSIWAELDASPDGPSNYLDTLARDLAKPDLLTNGFDTSWMTRHGVMWHPFTQYALWEFTGCNFQLLAFASAIRTSKPELQGQIGFECGTETRPKYRPVAGPAFVWVYNELATRDVALQQRAASGYDSEYKYAICGELGDFNGMDQNFVAYYKSSDTWVKWAREKYSEYDPSVGSASTEELLEFISRKRGSTISEC